MKAQFMGWVTDRTPNNPALCGNGGDYFHHRKIYQLEDGRMFCVYRTSADFDFCEVTGSFTEVVGAPLVINGEKIIVDNKELWAWVSKWLARACDEISPHVLSEEELAELGELENY